ncbi:MAG: NINE protein [Candidatus Moranbacteria bacterium]|nr:NINE protein [Candidatus Moranbacteria bacterium]
MNQKKNEKSLEKQPTGSGQPRAKKDRITAGVFAILLGGLGVHKFYMGEIGLGVLYLCFFWTGIPALVGLIEGIIYLTYSDEEFQKKYFNT